MFITFEGIEGSGKSSQIACIERYFKENDLSYIVTKEPGGTSFGQTIRSWLLNPDTTFYHAYSELLLFIVDRCEHVERVVKPALKAGKIVLCDRYKDSTIAYQNAGRQLDPVVIKQLNNLVDLEPDVTFLFDLPVEQGLARAKARAKLDRFEYETVSFHERIRSAYLDIVKQESERVLLVDASKPISDVTDQIISLLKAKLESVYDHKSIN
jgi:dTMP kinase